MSALSDAKYWPSPLFSFSRGSHIMEDGSSKQATNWYKKLKTSVDPNLLIQWVLYILSDPKQRLETKKTLVLSVPIWKLMGRHPGLDHPTVLPKTQSFQTSQFLLILLDISWLSPSFPKTSLGTGSTHQTISIQAQLLPYPVRFKSHTGKRSPSNSSEKLTNYRNDGRQSFCQSLVWNLS